MRFLKQVFHYGLGDIVAAILTVGLGVFLLSSQIGWRLTNLSYDLPYAIRPHIDNDQVVLIYMDDESHEILNQPYLGGWDRSATHARLVERLTADGAKAIIFDVVFSDPDPDEAKDIHFAEAISKAGNVILAADATPVFADRGQRASRIEIPTDSLLDATASIGTAELRPDEDLILRRITPPLTDEVLVPPLCWAATELLNPGISETLAKDGKTKWVKYYGPQGFLPFVSYYRALDTNDIAPGFFRNKVVFIGSKLLTRTSGERKDEYRSPYSYWLKDENLFMPGVEIQATLLLNLMRHDWLTRLSLFEELNFVVLLGLVFGIGLIQLRPFYASLMALIGVIIVGTLAYFLATKTNLWFAWLIIIVQIFVAYLWSVVFNSINLYVQKRLMQHSLGMYVSPAQVKRIIKQPDILKPGAVKQELSILFSDIASFTNMSEGLDSDELANFMNSYFESAVTNCIHETHGTVVKFIGDAIFAIWNAPERQKNHHELACKGAILLRDQVKSIKGPKPGLLVSTRIGLHAGEANVGNFGSSHRVDYTAIGENINLASRMEGLNKYLGTDLLITGDIEKAVRGKFVTRFLGLLQLKGFEKAVAVYELISLVDTQNEARPWDATFAEALEQFQNKDFEAAESGFKKALEMCQNDGPSEFYLKHIKELHKESLPEGWRGEIELKEK